MAVPEPKTHVALLVSPGMGHLIPFLELADRLVLHHNLQTTLFVVNTDSSSAADALLLQKSSAVNIVPIRHSSSSLDPTVPVVDRIKVMMTASYPHVRSYIAAAEPRPVALIVDLFGTEAIAMAHELGMLGFVFMPTSAWFLSLFFFFPCMDKQMLDAHAYNHEPLRIPGCSSVRFEDTIEGLEVSLEEVHEEFRRVARELGMADGILANTWQDLEPTTLKALNEAGTLSNGKVNKVPIYPIGPLARRGEPNLESEVLNWLDRQPDESVIYISFGSGGTLCGEQITELAWGLELSQQRFVWVIRPPAGTDPMGTFFTVETESTEKTSTEYLPEGFLKRTEEVGLVVPMWGPQAEILRHRSVRGFVTHCGWNSSIESIVNGVAMVTWPLYAEQKMNAVMLTEEIKVALRPKMNEKEGIVEKEEIWKVVKAVLEGEEGKKLREKMKELKEAGERAVGEDGLSTKIVCEMVEKWKNKIST